MNSSRDEFTVRCPHRVAYKGRQARDSSSILSAMGLDIVAYKGRDNELLVVECKSFLDSTGVMLSAFQGNHRSAKRYKIFRDKRLRTVVLKSLTKQLVDAGFCAARPRVKLCLAAGKVQGDESQLRQHFQRSGWVLLGPQDIVRELKLLGDSRYENAVASVVAKLLLRGTERRKTVKPGVDAEVS